MRERQWPLQLAILVGALPITAAITLAELVFWQARHYGGGGDAIGLMMMCLTGYGFALLVLVPTLLALAVRLRRKTASRLTQVLGVYALLALVVPPAWVYMPFLRALVRAA
jgi:uncharacterized membrane protein